MLITNILHYTLLHINNNFPATTDALCNGLRICNCKKRVEQYYLGCA